MKLLNISNKGRKIYLFKRDNNGRRIVDTDNSFFPYYYEENETDGKFKTYNGKNVKKLFVSHPAEIKKQRSHKAWEADIIYCKRYLIDKVKEIEKTLIKYAFIDIEIQSEVFPEPAKAEYSISCISIYNSFSNKIKTFYLPDYNSEFDMLGEFIQYLKQEKFDILTGWNFVDFDYRYLVNRFPNFAQQIGYKGMDRYGNKEDRFPAGTAIIDYMNFYKKASLNKEPSYALDAVAENNLGKGKIHGEVDFSKASKEVKVHNIEDVELMVKLENKFKLIPYYDEIRRLGVVEWEDLTWFSRIIDSLLLRKGHRRGIVLPSKPSSDEIKKAESFKGAYREAFYLGLHKGITKYDLSGAYPSMIIDFCLDPENVVNSGDKENKITIKTNKAEFIQNKKALLPSITKKLLEQKQKIKDRLNALSTEEEKYKNTKMLYNAVKSVVNSAFGTFGLRFFRMYNPNVAGSITFLVRDLLYYVEDKIKEKGYKLVYVDTDEVQIDSKGKDLTKWLNELVQQWAKEKYNKNKTLVNFELVGKFESLIITGKCRYRGRLRKPNGELEEITKGIESKRKDSSTYMKYFQKELLKKILDGIKKEDIINWIKEETKLIKERPLEEIGFPCKLSKKPSDYCTTVTNKHGTTYERKPPIFVQAIQNTSELDKKIGEHYFYIYAKKDKERLVYAFDNKKNKHINRETIDWTKIIERNILNKVKVIFEALDWKEDFKEIKEFVKGGKRCIR